MKKMLKSTVAAVMAVTILSISGIGASAYNDSASMTLRNVSGAPGNVTSGTLTIESNTNNSYYTSYDFAYDSSATVTVTTTNALSNSSVTLNKRNKSKTMSATARYSYITFQGNLSASSNESGTWSVS